MLLPLNENERNRLRAFLAANADCEALSEDEYVADLYDLEAPMSMDLVFVKDGVRVDGADVYKRQGVIQFLEATTTGGASNSSKAISVI